MIHPAFESLPWHTFVPSPADLELLVRATAQFLPEVHSFLVSLFVRFPISALVAQWSKQPTSPGAALLPRLLSCLLHLYVRLAGEPNAQSNPMMKRILEEACSYPWQHIDANVYDQVLNWYVSTCDPIFVLQPYMERTPTASGSNDALVFRLLQSASGYCSRPSPDPLAAHVDSAVKRQMFVRSWIRLVALNVSRHRSVVQKHPSAVQSAVDVLLEFIVATRNGSPDSSQALHEYLTAMAGSNPIADALQTGLCQVSLAYFISVQLDIDNNFLQRIESGGSDQNLLETLFRLTLALHGDLKRVAAVVESVLEHFEAPRNSLVRYIEINRKKMNNESQSCFV